MRKVLLVDDEYYFRQALMASFPWKENGFTVCGEARDGEEALEQVIALSPDIALVDINMPIRDGLAFARDIREGNYPLKIVMLSGHSEFAYARQALHLGVSDYLLKPVDDDALLQTLRELDTQLEREERQQLEMTRLRQQATDSGDVPLVKLAPAILKKNLLPASMRVNLLMNMRTLNRDAAATIVAGAFDEAREEMVDQDTLAVFCMDLASLCLELLDDMAIDEQTVFPDRSARLADHVHALHTPAETEACAMDLLTRTMDALAARRHSKAEQLVLDVKSLVGKHLADERLSVEYLSKSLFVHYSHLCHVFKRETGLTLNEYITGRRMETAKALFDQGNQSVSDVAARVGYQDANYFGKLFKKHFGPTPSRYVEAMGATR
jgi:two-component system response regulator YesN